MSWSNTGERGWAYRGEPPMSSEKDLTIEALEKKLKIKEGTIDLMGQFTEKLQAEIDDLQENFDKKLKEALANSDACWKLEQEMYVRQRDEARAEVERLRALLPPSAHTGVRNGPGEGSWAVFAEKVVEERDEARSMLLDADSHIEELKYLNRKAQAEIEVLRGVGCREVKADEPESGPCGVCLRCAEERGAKWALDSVGWSREDDRWSIADRICRDARGKR